MSSRCRQEQEITREAPGALRTASRVRAGTRDAGQVPSAGRLVCTRCGAIEEFADEAITTVTAALGHGFEVEAHVLELHGHCRACRPAGRLQGSC